MDNPEPREALSPEATAVTATDRLCVAEVKKESIVQSSLKAFLELKALVWPVAIAVLVGLFHYLGRAAVQGKVSALGVYELTDAHSSQDYVFLGITVVAKLALQVGLMLLFGAALFFMTSWLARFLSPKLQIRLRAFLSSRWTTYLRLTLAISTVIAMAKMANDLALGVDSMILKPPMELGLAWLRMSLDQGKDWALGYELLLSAGIAFFLYLSARILATDFKRFWLKIAYAAWVGIQTLNLLFNFAVMVGAISTIEPYPVVSFSNAEQLLGKHMSSVLIGSDDKMFAFLVVNAGPESENPMPKTILYLPRSEVKWMTIVTKVPLHLLSHSQELKHLVPPSQR